MSNEPAVGSEFSAAPYLLDDAAAQAYERGVKEPPRRWRTNIHTDRDAASKAGFTAPIAAGEHTIALAMQLIVDRFGERFMHGGGFEVALIKPVLFGDTLTVHARVARADERNLELDLRVENQKGEPVLTGTARVPKQ
ncbi:MAG TPA: MaoC/PaaZ C-terminal domain-containing protein [Candidatus Binataceae bacterium]|nr:MaoC/PaaZ C-terminal domain-containing protein [Candidatus Binataceae bacterium]